MTELEIRKMQLEVQALDESRKRDRIKYLVDIVQGFSIIIGVIIAINEFILKDRESENQKSKVTLEYVQKITDKEIVLATDSLKYFRDIFFSIPVGDIREDSLFENISSRFDKATLNLSHYYNVLHEGIANGYFDKNICNTFLAFNVSETINVLGELQSRHGGLQTKRITPNYKRFRGMIEFYIECFNVKRFAIKHLPKYDIDKPTQ